LGKQKASYAPAVIELVLFDLSDIVTASNTSGGLLDNDPNDWGDWT